MLTLVERILFNQRYALQEIPHAVFRHMAFALLVLGCICDYLNYVLVLLS
jgi:hypothetical protein